jgi:DNA-binding transcriptional LysR family regulator
MLPEGSVDTDDLRHGRVDLEIGADLPALPEFRSETVGHDRLVAVRRHAGKLDLAAYAAQPHVLVSRRGRLSDPVDEILAGHGLRRRVLASVGTSASALTIVSRSAAVVTTPEAVCRPLIEALGLAVEALPFSLPEAPIVCVWHQRYDTDTAHAWLREQVRGAVTAVLRETGDP